MDLADRCADASAFRAADWLVATLTHCSGAGCTQALSGANSFVPGPRGVFGADYIDEQHIGVGVSLHTPSGFLYAFGGGRNNGGLVTS